MEASERPRKASRAQKRRSRPLPSRWSRPRSPNASTSCHGTFDQFEPVLGQMGEYLQSQQQPQEEEPGR
jgi:hypothetical protein